MRSGKMQEIRRQRRGMRMVQVGCLGMGKWWVQVGLKSPDVEVAGYVDVNPDHLKVIQDEFDIQPSRCYLDLDKALAELKPDAVLIVTPPQFHEAIAVKAMEAGCHVLTEKPLADTWEACLRTVQAVRRTGRTMMVAKTTGTVPKSRPCATPCAQAAWRAGTGLGPLFPGPSLRGISRRDALSSHHRHVDPPLRHDALHLGRRSQKPHRDQLEP